MGVLKPFRQPLHKRYFLKCSAASESTPETEQTHKTKQLEDLMERVKQYEPGVARFTEQQLDSKMNADVVSEKVQSLLKKKGHTVETVDAKISMFLLLQNTQQKLRLLLGRSQRPVSSLTRFNGCHWQRAKSSRQSTNTGWRISRLITLTVRRRLKHCLNN